MKAIRQKTVRNPSCKLTLGIVNDLNCILRRVAEVKVQRLSKGRKLFLRDRTAQPMNVRVLTSLGLRNLVLDVPNGLLQILNKVALRSCTPQVLDGVTAVEA